MPDGIFKFFDSPKFTSLTTSKLNFSRDDVVELKPPSYTDEVIFIKVHWKNVTNFKCFL